MNGKRLAACLLAAAALVAGLPSPAQAHGGRYHGHHGGRWVYGHHHGHLGWWWTAGGLWYLYPRPVYVYPGAYATPETVLPQAPVDVQPPAQYWYYCDAAKGYYPYVPSCPGGWREVPATPPAGAPQ